MADVQVSVRLGRKARRDAPVVLSSGQIFVNDGADEVGGPAFARLRRGSGGRPVVVGHGVSLFLHESRKPRERQLSGVRHAQIGAAQIVQLGQPVRDDDGLHPRGAS